MSKVIKPLRTIRSPKARGTINKTALRRAIKKVSAKRTDSQKKSNLNAT